MLSGAGGDELFGGYPWRYYRAVVNDDFDHYIDKYYRFWQRLIPNTTIARVFAPISADVAGVWTRDIFRDVFTHHPDEFAGPEDYINHSLYFEAQTFLHGLLVVEDKLSMAHSLETRVPFLDNDLVEFAQRVPVGMKLGNLGEVVRLNENEPGPKTKQFFERTRDGKLLLRKAMERYVPRRWRRRPSRASPPPMPAGSGARASTTSAEPCSTATPRSTSIWTAATVHGLIDEHLAGRANRRLLIWSLLSVEQWCRTFLLGERPSAGR